MFEQKGYMTTCNIHHISSLSFYTSFLNILLQASDSKLYSACCLAKSQLIRVPPHFTWAGINRWLINISCRSQELALNTALWQATHPPSVKLIWQTSRKKHTYKQTYRQLQSSQRFLKLWTQLKCDTNMSFCCGTDSNPCMVEAYS